MADLLEQGDEGVNHHAADAGYQSEEEDDYLYQPAYRRVVEEPGCGAGDEPHKEEGGGYQPA